MNRKQPIQQRSVEKRNIILKAGFSLMTEKGYHNTTTDEIAQKAGISTGIIYRYFSNKKEILVAAANDYIDAMEEVYFKVPADTDFNNPKSVLTTIFDRFITMHTEYTAIHEEMESLRHSDKEIAEVYNRLDNILIDYLKEAVLNAIPDKENLNERVWIVIQLLEGYCHLIIHPQSNLDLCYLKKEIIAQSIYILES